MTDITDEIYDKVANAMQIPPALLKGDIADVSVLTKNLITFAIDPYAEMMAREINRKRSGKEVLNGTYIMIDTSTIMHREPLDEAQNMFNMVGAGWSKVSRSTAAQYRVEWEAPDLQELRELRGRGGCRGRREE